jgi:phosphate transport system substrate-binding protein
VLISRQQTSVVRAVIPSGPPEPKGQHVKLQRHGILAGIALTATLALAACGTDDNSDTPSTGTSSGSASAISCASGSLTAQGSSAQANAMAQWVKDYQTACPSGKINYQATSSGAGQQALIGGTADFAGSDSPLTAADQPKADTKCGAQAIHLPMVVGPIAVVFNVQGVDKLQLKAATIAKIYSGAITSWDAAEIKADNPGVTLPATKIVAVHRADDSGTTDNFTKFLSKAAAADWTYANNKTWKAPGGQGEQKSDGVATAVGAGNGTIGYVEWSFAQAKNLKMAKIGNASNEFVELTGEAAGKTIASAKVTGTGADLQLSIDYNTTAAGAYPIVLVTYEIVCSKGTSAAALPVLKSFLTYASSSAGQASAVKVGYAPLPDEVRTKVATAITALS